MINNININWLLNVSSFIADIIDNIQNTPKTISRTNTTAVLMMKISFDLLIPNIPPVILSPFHS